MRVSDVHFLPHELRVAPDVQAELAQLGIQQRQGCVDCLEDFRAVNVRVCVGGRVGWGAVAPAEALAVGEVRAGQLCAWGSERMSESLWQNVVVPSATRRGHCRCVGSGTICGLLPRREHSRQPVRLGLVCRHRGQPTREHAEVEHESGKERRRLHDSVVEVNSWSDLRGIGELDAACDDFRIGDRVADLTCVQIVRYSEVGSTTQSVHIRTGSLGESA